MFDTMMDNMCAEFVGLFDADDQYTASIIYSDRLVVSIVEQPTFMSAYMSEPKDQAYCVVCSEFPGFFLEAGVSLEAAFEFIDFFGLNH